jgi:hypothetical protein
MLSGLQIRIFKSTKTPHPSVLRTLGIIHILLISILLQFSSCHQGENQNPDSPRIERTHLDLRAHYFRYLYDGNKLRIIPYDKSGETADSLFIRFAPKFAKKGDYQNENILFPLKLVTNEKTEYIATHKWEQRDLHFGWEFSTMLHMGNQVRFQTYYEMLNDSNCLITVRYKQQKHFETFVFVNTEHNWSLTELRYESIPQSDKECFFAFIDKFCGSHSFHNSRISPNATIEDWADFALEKRKTHPIQPAKKENGLSPYIYQTIYIRDFNPHSDTVTIRILGEGTCYNSYEYFIRRDGLWYLQKYDIFSP